ATHGGGRKSSESARGIARLVRYSVNSDRSWQELTSLVRTTIGTPTTISGLSRACPLRARRALEYAAMNSYGTPSPTAATRRLERFSATATSIVVLFGASWDAWGSSYSLTVFS